MSSEVLQTAEVELKFKDSVPENQTEIIAEIKDLWKSLLTLNTWSKQERCADHSLSAASTQTVLL